MNFTPSCIETSINQVSGTDKFMNRLNFAALVWNQNCGIINDL